MNITLTQHALDRYMERTNCKNVLRGLNNIEHLLASAVRIGKNRVYASGLILKVHNGVVTTVYKPTHQRDFRQIYNAKNRK